MRTFRSSSIRYGTGPASETSTRSENEPWELYNVGAYSFADYKVCWREQMTTFTVAVAHSDGRPPIVDHKLVSVGFDDSDEAYFLAAVLNSTPVRVLVDSYALELSLSSSLLDYVAVPRFARANVDHRTLADLSRQAHGPLIAGQADAVQEEVDRRSAALWGVNPTDLAVLRRFANHVTLPEGESATRSNSE